MTLLHQVLFRHIVPLHRERLPLASGGALFSQQGFDRLLEGSLPPLDPARSPALPGSPEWSELRQRWAEALPLERSFQSASLDGWRESIRRLADIDWNRLLSQDVGL